MNESRFVEMFLILMCFGTQLICDDFDSKQCVLPSNSAAKQ